MQGIKSTFAGSGEPLAGPGQLEPRAIQVTSHWKRTVLLPQLQAHVCTVPSQDPGGSTPSVSVLTWLVTELEGSPYYKAQKSRRMFTWLPDFMSFMFMAFFMPLPFSFLFFFFLQQHFLQMQKQQVRMRSPATTAMAMRAQGGTEGKSQSQGQPCSSLQVPAIPPPRTGTIAVGVS